MAVLFRKIHNDRTEFEKEFTLQGFGEEVRNHVLGWTVLHAEFTILDAIGDEIKTHVDIFGAFAG